MLAQMRRSHARFPCAFSESSLVTHNSSYAGQARVCARGVDALCFWKEFGKGYAIFLRSRLHASLRRKPQLLTLDGAAPLLAASLRTFPVLSSVT